MYLFKKTSYISTVLRDVEDVLNGETGNIACCINSIIRETDTIEKPQEYKI